MIGRRAAGLVISLVCAGSGIGCHVTSRVESTRVADTRLVPRDEPPRASPLALTLDDDGRLHAAEPLRCRDDVVVELETTEVVRIKPNLAAVVVGITAASLGGVATFLGLSDDDPAGSPLTYAGPAAVVAGLPFVVGPWIGTRTERRDRGTSSARRGTRDRACGSRPVVARTAVVTAGSWRAVAQVDDAGALSLAPFVLVDAFDPTLRPLDVRADLVTDTGVRSVQAILEPRDFARGKDAFLRAAGIDAAVEPLRKAPGLEAGAIRVTRGGGPHPALRVSLRLGNAGPGDAFAVRARIAARHPEVDGRLIYFGRIPARTTVTREVELPLSESAARELTGTLELSLELADAHDTAPDAPVRFRGPIAGP
jgi:hypothetical protein